MLKNQSIKTQIIAYLVIATIAIVSIGGGIAYIKLKDEAHRLFDSELIQSAQILTALISTESQQNDFTALQKNLDLNHELLEYKSKQNPEYATEYEQDGEHRIGFQVWSSEQKLLLKSTDFPHYRVSDVHTGFTSQKIDDDIWRIYSMRSPDNHFLVITAEKLEARLHLMEEAGEGISQLFFASFITLLLTLYIAMTFAFKPLQRLINRIKQQDVNQLQPFKNDSDSQEIQQITHSLNQLIDKVKQALQHEKQLTSDAAHQLRTPLAGIKIHAELALACEDAQEKDESIHKLIKGVEHSTQMVNQLLLLSKVQAHEASQTQAMLQLDELIQQELKAQSALIEAKALHISCHLEPTKLHGDKDQIGLMIQNILSNAVKFTPDKGKIDIRLNTENKHVTLQIMDNGPGVKANDRENIMQRFYRASDTQHIEGSGIGLSIVKNILDTLHASIEFKKSDFKTGLKVVIVFKKESF